MKIAIPQGHGLPQPLFFACTEEWGSDSSDYRQQLRARLVDEARRMGNLTEGEAETWLDLSRPPQANQIFCSISHTRRLGGFVLSRVPVGFDIEALGRVSKRVVDRISTPVEVLNAPDGESLWVAKEAVFKCLQGKHQPTVLSEIHISTWEPTPQGAFLYQATTQKAPPRGIRGVVWRDETWIFSLCFLISSI